MPIWSDSFLSRKAREAEEEIAQTIGCVIDRYCLEGNLGQELYELPTYIHTIRQITWKGKRLDPITYEELRGIIDPKPALGAAFEDTAYNDLAFAAGATQLTIGEPRYYIYDTNGFNKILLYPVPNETLGTTAADLWAPAQIGSYCIAEITRNVDLTGNTYRVPTYLRRRLVKNYVLSKAFAMEGKGQDLEASEYYALQYNFWLLRCKSQWHKITRMNTRSRPDYPGGGRVEIAAPRFPSNYGVTL